MRSVHAFLAASLGLVTMIAGAPPLVIAQEATPVPVAADLSTLSTELVGLLPGVTLPADADIVAVRAVFAPGVVSPFAPGPDAAATLVIMERGQLTITVDNEPWSISRQAALVQAMATPAAEGDLFELSAEIGPGAPGTLGVGDMTLIPMTGHGEIRNVSLEPATALLIVIGPASPAAATPQP